MSWFNPTGLQGSLDSIRSTVTNSLKEVFEEEEPQDPGAHLALTKERLETASKVIEDQKAEMDRLKANIDELQEQKQVRKLKIALQIGKGVHMSFFFYFSRRWSCRRRRSAASSGRCCGRRRTRSSTSAR